jgi:hypothetical protein
MRGTSNAASGDASAAECSRTSTTGCLSPKSARGSFHGVLARASKACVGSSARASPCVASDCNLCREAVRTQGSNSASTQNTQQTRGVRLRCVACGMLPAGVATTRCLARRAWASGASLCGAPWLPRRARPAGAARTAPTGRCYETTDFREATAVNPTERKERRGFASMSPERQREIASKGGRAAHAKGTAHEWTPEEARSAGRKGGQVSRGGRGRLPAEPVGVELPPSPE